MESVNYNLVINGNRIMFDYQRLVHLNGGSIINVGVTSLTVSLPTLFFAKNKHTRLTCFTIKVSKS